MQSIVPLFSTNPCAEQPYQMVDAVTGAVNLERYVDDNGNFMIESFKDTVKTTRF